MNFPKSRVLLVSEYFPPHWTGISKAFYQLAQNLLKQGYNVTVLTTQFDTKTPLEEDLDGLTIIRSPYQFQLSRTHYSASIVMKFLTMVGAYDNVVINSPNSNILLFSIITKLTGRHLSIYHQGDLTLPRQTGNQVFHFLLEKVFDIFTIPSFALANVASTYTKDYAQNSRVMKYFLYKFRPFVPEFKLTKQKPSAAFKKKMAALQKKHRLIGFAGRFVEEKGYDILMDTIPQVVKEIPHAHFVFAGKKNIDYEPFYQKHKNRIEKNRKHITFLGLLDEKDLSYFYDSIELFTISSRTDCFPTTQIEAAYKKVPIVVTDIPGARMLVKKTGFGEIAAAHNPASLAKAIIKTLTNTKKYDKKYSNVTAFFKTYENFNID